MLNIAESFPIVADLSTRSGHLAVVTQSMLDIMNGKRYLFAYHRYSQLVSMAKTVQDGLYYDTVGSGLTLAEYLKAEGLQTLYVYVQIDAENLRFYTDVYEYGTSIDGKPVIASIAEPMRAYSRKIWSRMVAAWAPAILTKYVSTWKLFLPGWITDDTHRRISDDVIQMIIADVLADPIAFTTSMELDAFRRMIIKAIPCMRARLTVMLKHTSLCLDLRRMIARMVFA